MERVNSVSPWFKPSDQKDRWSELQRKRDNKPKKEQQDKAKRDKTDGDNLIGWA